MHSKAIFATTATLCHFFRPVVGSMRLGRGLTSLAQPALSPGVLVVQQPLNLLQQTRKLTEPIKAASLSRSLGFLSGLGSADKRQTMFFPLSPPTSCGLVREMSGSPESNQEVSFTALEHGTKEDWDLMCKVYAEATTGPKLAKRSLDMLLGLKGEEFKLTAKVDMFEHSIQTATRALRDGADEDTIVTCLLHDIGELMSPSNHGEIASGLLRPYISPANAWALANHEVFQGYYYYHHVGGDRHAREVFKDHEFYQYTVDFCHKWDQPSFDPDYKSESLDVFVPMVERVFARRPFFWDLTHPKACAVVAGGSSSHE